MIGTQPTWWIWLIVISLLGVFYFWDFKSRIAKNRIFRLAAITLAIFALLALYTKPYLIKSRDAETIALVTDHADNNTLDSLRQLNIPMVNTFDQYLQYTVNENLSKLIVVGDGLESWELEQLRSSIIHLPSEQVIEGPTDYWPEKLVENAQSTLTFGIQTNDSLKLLLTGAGIPQQARMLTPNQAKVAFDIVPNLAGDLLYQLNGVRGTDTIFKELVPMHIMSSNKSSVLVLSDAPSSELRYLKNYLITTGYGVAERMRVSKETYRESFSNVPKKSLLRLSTTLLEEFQLLVIDGASYDGLSAADRRNVMDKLTTGEIGLVWMGGKSPNAPIKISPTNSQKLIFQGKDNDVELASVPWRSESGEAVLLQNHVVGRVKSVGLGNIVTPEIAASFSLVLRGEQELYAQLWQQLLQPVVGKIWQQSDQVLPRFARVNEPTLMAIMGNDGELKIESIQLPLSEQWYLPNHWNATHWPNQRGWATVQLPTSQSTFFVFDSTDWPVQKVVAKKKLMNLYASDQFSESVTKVEYQNPISAWYFFVLFVISMGFLWLEQRVG
jgi:hypothetical protein